MKGHTNPTVRTTEENEQVGPKMHSALKLVGSSGPVACKNRLAKKVGPHGSQDYGYRIVNRLVKKNLVALHPEHEDASPGSRGAVILTDKGARYLNEHTDTDLDPNNYVDADAMWSRANNEWKHY